MAAAVMDKGFKLVTPYPVVEVSVGDDVTLPSHLSPETSAVAMEIRWFKGTDCIYLYKNGHVTVRVDYVGRVSVNTQELQRGDISMTLRGRIVGDEGVYTCQIISGEHKEVGRLWLKPLRGGLAGVVAGVVPGVVPGVVSGVTGVGAGLLYGAVFSSGPVGIGAGMLFGLTAGLTAAKEVGDKMKREITAEERKRMEESVQSLALLAWRKATDELMEKNKQLEEKNREMEKTKQQLKEKNEEMEKMKQQLEDTNEEMEKTKQQLKEKCSRDGLAAM